MDWAGYVVIKANGRTNVKIVLILDGYDDNGYLPATKIDFSTSLKFQTLTNQILVVASINQILYKIIMADISMIIYLMISIFVGT